MTNCERRPRSPASFAGLNRLILRYRRSFISDRAATYTAREVLAGKSEERTKGKRERFRLRSFFLIRAVAAALIRG